uniref:ORF121 n=1 Tax=Cnaphalocrocis medinalis granulovirus TaxID=1750712 RepID=A0A0X9FCR4_9BBAC|nr:ORF121 [Cnaphalocrocis medinalis granulovirus]
MFCVVFYVKQLSIRKKFYVKQLSIRKKFLRKAVISTQKILHTTQPISTCMHKVLRKTFYVKRLC